MNLVTAWLRLELPRRWRSLAVLTLLIAVASGTVLASIAGARRGASALERLQERTKPAAVLLVANLLAAIPGRRRAAHLKISQILRTE